jgi:hypothetical protein
MRLEDPVMHRRKIVLHKWERLVVIEDTLQMAAQHDIELLFHCSERCHVEAAPGGYALKQSNKTLLLKLPCIEGASSQVLIGGVSPIFGWVSRRLDNKLPAPTIVWKGRLKGEIVLRTEISC